MSAWQHWHGPGALSWCERRWRAAWRSPAIARHTDAERPRRGGSVDR
ncbi:MAG: hypothetical protein MZW92_07370 [Comamonadaceae bacterium]|nr:hypothetical protein [Comamonadaceae bacterium]